MVVGKNSISASDMSNHQVFTNFYIFRLIDTDREIQRRVQRKFKDWLRQKRDKVIKNIERLNFYEGSKIKRLVNFGVINSDPCV